MPSLLGTCTDTKVFSRSMVAFSVSTTPAVYSNRCIAQSDVTATSCEHKQMPDSSMTTIARR